MKNFSTIVITTLGDIMKRLLHHGNSIRVCTTIIKMKIIIIINNNKNNNNKYNVFKTEIITIINIICSKLK